MRLPHFIEKRRQKRRRSSDHLSAFSNRIGTGFLLEGDFQAQGNYWVDGQIRGNAEIDGVVALGEAASWKGDVTADYVQVAGKFEGQIVAHSKIELTATAVVIGDLSAPLIAIAEGAQYQGSINRPRKTQVTRYRERRGQNEPKAKT